MAMAAAEPSPAAVMTWARGLTAFPAAQAPGMLVPPVASTATPAVVVSRAAEVGEQRVVGDEPRSDEHGGSGNHLTGCQFDPGEAVVLDDEAGDRSVDDSDGAGGELLSLRRGEGIPVGEVDDVVGPLTDEVGMGERFWRTAEDAQGLFSDLVAVAVRAVEQISAPPFAHAGEVRGIVAQTRGDQDTTAPHSGPVVEPDVEAHPPGAGMGRVWRDRVDAAGQQVPAVAGDLVPTCGQQLGRR